MLKTAPVLQSQRTPVKVAAPKLLIVRLPRFTLLGSSMVSVAPTGMTVVPPPIIAPPDHSKLLLAVKLAVPALLDAHCCWSSCICVKLMLSRAMVVLPASRLARAVFGSGMNIAVAEPAPANATLVQVEPLSRETYSALPAIATVSPVDAEVSNGG